MKVSDLMNDDYFWKYYENKDVDLCSLCGNSGIIDTRQTAISGAAVNAGRLNYCFCPNGRVMREQKWPLEECLVRHKQVASTSKMLDAVEECLELRKKLDELKQECMDCGSTNITTKIEHEILGNFECDTPVRHCEECHISWVDSEGIDARTLAQFKYEKSMGKVRTNLKEHEQKLWEQANSG